MKVRLLLFVVLLPVFAFAQTDIYIRGAGKLFPVALPQLCLEGGDASAAKEIPRILARDLDLSGYFEVINPASYLETPGKCDGAGSVAYSDWTVIGAEGLVRGVVSSDPAGVRIRLYLHDVQLQKVVLGKEYAGDLTQIPRIAHKFANELLKFFTGDYGVFGTQIAFSSRVGRFKELFVMDMDGSNIRQLTSEKALAMSSSWDPAGRKLVYTSYRSRMPDLFEIDVFSRITRQVTRRGELIIGSKYSRDGRSILTSGTQGGDSDIFILGSDGSMQKRLTKTPGSIDVSPDWSPDGNQIAFCSNRGGGPQIYTMNADGSNAKRISFVTSNYCTSPDWSPKGDKIAFVCRADGGFQMFSANPDGSNPLQLTSSGSSEDPDFSPDGRYITFATTMWKRGSYSIAIIRSDGTSMRQLTVGRGSDSEPAWGPLSD